MNKPGSGRQWDSVNALTTQDGKIDVETSHRQQMNTNKNTAITIHVYVSCARTEMDEKLYARLNEQLSMLKRQPDIHFWDKQSIDAGANWQQEIVDRISQAHLILLLFSSDFLASDECYQEMELAAKGRDERGACVIPILMRPSDWQNTLIHMLKPLPTDRKSISEQTDCEKALHDVAGHIRDIIEKIRQGLSATDTTTTRSDY